MNRHCYNIRVEVCEKCYQHYNQSLLNANSKSCHTLKQLQTIQQKQNIPLDFFQEQQQYKQLFESLISSLSEVQEYFILKEQRQNQELNFTLQHKESKVSKNNNINLKLNPPTFNVLRNKPFKYLTKVPDTKLSTKRYLNHCTNKIVQFPRKDSFEIYFENLLLFSKISFKQWPNIKLIAELIKILVQYCQKNGPLMQRLNQFIYPQFQVKSPDHNQNHLTLYEYLLVSSNCSDPLIEYQKDRNNLVKILKDIILGKVSVINYNPNENGVEGQNSFKKKILPYTFFDPKVKTTTIQNIYIGKQNKTERGKYKHRVLVNNSNVKEQSTKKILNKTLTENTKRTSRPLSSNPGFKLKTSASFQNKGNNKIFTMIKMGDFQQNIQQKNIKNTFHISKSLNKQLSNLCNVSKQNNVKEKNEITKKAKLFLSSNFKVVQNEIKKDEQESIIWTNLTKTSPYDKRDSGSQLSMNFNQTDGYFNMKNSIKKGYPQNDYFSKDNDNKSQKSKIVPSKKLARASLFLNQIQNKNLAQQLKQFQSNGQKKKKKKSPTTSQKNSFSSSSSSGISSSNSSKKKQKSQDQFENDEFGMNQVYKLNVVKKNLAKRDSNRSSLSSQPFNRNSKLNEFESDNFSNKLLHIDNEPIIPKSPTKLAVKSRRKSSFYYSNEMNNLLLKKIQQENEAKKEKGEKEPKKKKLKRKGSHRKSRVANKNPVEKVEQGIQVNFDSFDQQLTEDKPITKDQNQSQSQSQKHCIYDSRVSQTKQKTIIFNIDQAQMRKKQSEMQNQGNNSFLKLKVSRQKRPSFTNRTPKISIGLRQNSLKQKDQNEVVIVFPQNKFQHAFILQKFIQKDYYELQIKKVFTTNPNEKTEAFQFHITCEEQTHPFQIQSVKEMFQKCSDKKLVLFPKIFQQVENYSTPLAEVVNRLLKFHPISISRLFTNAHGISPLGQYCIWIYHKDINQFKPVYINDQIAFHTVNHDINSFMMPRKLKDPIYGPFTNEQSIWFMLLEKALAKVMGSYYELNETKIADIFRMLTGCPVVNIENFTSHKLQRIFSEKIFLNKKAYVYALRKHDPSNLRIDRIIGIDINKQSSEALVKVEQQENNEMNLQIQTLIRRYQQISLVFFNLNFVFNQIRLPKLVYYPQKSSTLISFYIVNEQSHERNQIFICLGGFHKKNIKSKIIIYKQTQQDFNQDLIQLQLTDPLSYYENKYSYEGEIQKSGNHFFETEIKYGKYLCLVEAYFQPEHQYFLSTYSSKSLTIHEATHNYVEKQVKAVDPLQKIIAATNLRRKMRFKASHKNISQDENFMQKPPHKILKQFLDPDQDLVPYDFKNYKSSKKNKFKSSVSLDSQRIESKWVIDKNFIQDKQFVEEQRKRRLSSIIKQVQKEQEKNFNNKLRMQIKKNDADPVLKMISKVEEKSKFIALNENSAGVKTIKKKKAQGIKKIQWRQSVIKNS